jgi:predicted 2-oxoglutarate/Fe(II)-dependent dioxygenase YbiX
MAACFGFPNSADSDTAAPAGGAVVFSCSLLHEATPVTSGSRYVFLPFLYDDEAARIRQQNLQYIKTNTNGAPMSRKEDNVRNPQASE